MSEKHPRDLVAMLGVSELDRDAAVADAVRFEREACIAAVAALFGADAGMQLRASRERRKP